MKKAYTEMHTHLKQQAKLFGVSFERLIEASSTTREFDEFGKDWLAHTCLKEIDLEVEEGNGLHFFMPGAQFCDWLVSCVPELNKDHAYALAELLDDRNGVLHFPSNQGFHSVAFAIPRECYTLNGDRAPDNSMLIMSFSTSALKCDLAHVSVRLNNDGTCSDGAMKYARLIVGLSLYLSCFPEMRRDGLPEDIKHPNHFRHQTNVSIGVSESMIERGGPSPHYRSGHFRYLSAERFTKKKGQTVFVTGCFVKGKASTVSEIT